MTLDTCHTEANHHRPCTTRSTIYDPTAMYNISQSVNSTNKLIKSATTDDDFHNTETTKTLAHKYRVAQ